MLLSTHWRSSSTTIYINSRTPSTVVSCRACWVVPIKCVTSHTYDARTYVTSHPHNETRRYILAPWLSLEMELICDITHKSNAPVGWASFPLRNGLIFQKPQIACPPSLGWLSASAVLRAKTLIGAGRYRTQDQLRPSQTKPGNERPQFIP